MKTFDEMMDETERITKNRHEYICRTIIFELEKIYHVSFPVIQNHMTYGSFVQTILFTPALTEYRPKTLDLLEQYQVDERNIVFRFLMNIHQFGLPEQFKLSFETVFKTLPYCKNMEKIQDGYIIETKSRVVEAYQLSKMIQNRNLYKLLEQNMFQGHCHEAVEIGSSYFRTANIITSELTSMFGGMYYHSYFKGENTEDVIDLSTNTLYKENTFDTFYEPKELQCIPSSKLDEYLATIPEEKKHCKVLKLAIQNKQKMEES